MPGTSGRLALRWGCGESAGGVRPRALPGGERPALKLGCRLVAAALLGFVSACGGGGGTGESMAPEPPELGLATLLPLDAGNRWVYAREPRGNADIVVEAVGPSSSGGRAGTLVRTLHYDALDQEAVASVETQLMSASTAAIVQLPLSSGDPLTVAIGAFDVLRGPVRIGDRFQQVDQVVTTVDLDGDGIPDRTRITSNVEILARETVTVPAGRFDDALKVRTTIVQGATASTTGRSLRIEATDDTWFAAGVGIVRSRIDVVVDGQPYSSSERALKAFGLADRRSESTPPGVLSVEPAGDSQARITPTLIEIRVDERLDVYSLPERLLLRDSRGVAIPGRTSQFRDIVNGGYLVRFEPGTAPWPSGDYTLTLSADTIDMLGNRLGADFVNHYRIDSDAPRLASSMPGPGATDTPIDAVIELRFDEPIRFLGGGYGPASGLELRKLGTDYTVQASLEVGEDSIRIAPALALGRGTSYELSLASWALSDQPGNPLAQTLLLQFTTDPGWYGPAQPAIMRSAGTLLVDIDADGRVDIWGWADLPGGSIQARELVTMRQMPDGTLSPTVNTGIVLNRPCHVVRRMAEGDMNGDGRIDLVVADGCNVSLLLQRADGSLEPGLRTVVPGASGDLRVADVDGDGRDDIVLHAASTPTSLGFHLWLQMADGSFMRQEVFVAVGNTPQLRAFELADVDGNGLLDLVTLATDGDPFVYRYGVALQQAGGGFAAAQTLPAVAGNALGVADIDGDGRADIFGAGRRLGTDLVQWVRLGATGSLEQVVLMPVLGSADHIAFADADGDGRIDVLVAHGDGSGLGVLRQTAGGALEDEASYDEGNADLSAGLRIGDLNGDGQADVLFGDHWLPSLAGRP